VFKAVAQLKLEVNFEGGKSILLVTSLVILSYFEIYMTCWCCFVIPLTGFFFVTNVPLHLSGVIFPTKFQVGYHCRDRN
jgi:hypothetical protein